MEHSDTNLEKVVVDTHGKDENAQGSKNSFRERLSCDAICFYSALIPNLSICYYSFSTKYTKPIGDVTVTHVYLGQAEPLFSPFSSLVILLWGVFYVWAYRTNVYRTQPTINLVFAVEKFLFFLGYCYGRYGKNTGVKRTLCGIEMCSACYDPYSKEDLGGMSTLDRWGWFDFVYSVVFFSMWVKYRTKVAESSSHSVGL